MPRSSKIRLVAITGLVSLIGAPFTLAAGNPAGTHWITLGTMGGPIPSKDRAQPANLLIVNGRDYLVDAGNGVATGLARVGVDCRDIGTVFISHNHNDHNADMGTLMGIAWTEGRSQPIDLYGPPGIEAAIQGFLRFFAANAEIRASDQSMPVPPEKVFLAHDIAAPGVIFKDANIKVTAAENTHFHFRPGSPAEGKHKSYAFRFDTPDRAIVYTGDTGPSEPLIELAKGAGTLISEVINIEAMEKGLASQKGWQTASAALKTTLMRHLRQDHLSPEEVGRIAARAGVKEVVLTHLVPAVPDGDLERVFINGVKKFYSGKVVVANDLMTF
jgi:ribonuclease BN (tRNA processing enzyme)